MALGLYVMHGFLFVPGSQFVQLQPNVMMMMIIDDDVRTTYVVHLSPHTECGPFGPHSV